MYPSQLPKAKKSVGGKYGPASDGGKPGKHNTNFVAEVNRFANIGYSHLYRQNIPPHMAQDVLAARRAPRRQYALDQFYKAPAKGQEIYTGGDPRGMVGGAVEYQKRQDYFKNLALRSIGSTFTNPEKTPLGANHGLGIRYHPHGQFLRVLDPEHQGLATPTYRGY